VEGSEAWVVRECGMWVLTWSDVVRDPDGMDMRRDGVEVRWKKAESRKQKAKSKGWDLRGLGICVAVEPALRWWLEHEHFLLLVDLSILEWLGCDRLSLLLRTAIQDAYVIYASSSFYDLIRVLYPI
jgi:hypothetical protein